MKKKEGSVVTELSMYNYEKTNVVQILTTEKNLNR